jgi:hypothetical protein
MSTDVLRHPTRPALKRSLLTLALSLSSAGILMTPAQAFDLFQPFKSIVILNPLKCPYYDTASNHQ